MTPKPYNATDQLEVGREKKPTPNRASEAEGRGFFHRLLRTTKASAGAAMIHNANIKPMFLS
jgi:hypothetical protein